MPRTQFSLAACVLALALVPGCTTDSGTPNKAGADGAQTRKDGKKKTPPTEAKADSKAEEDEEVELGSIREDAPIPLLKMFGQAPQVVESFLGEHLGKGDTRDSCVRYIPEKAGAPTERTWFRCKHVWQRYADKELKFTAVRVEFEDGKCTAISIEGFSGEGEFDHRKVLEIIGVSFPGEPSIHHPADGVTVWSYFNNATRLRIDGKEYRAEVSVVEDDFSRAKVEILLNHHLTDEERARVTQIGKRKVGAPAGETPTVEK